MNYQIIIADSAHHLVRLVNLSIKSGWEPLGGAFCSPSGKFHQSIVKTGT